MLGKVTRQKRLPAVGAERDGSQLFFVALRLHQRNELARDEREGDEDGGEHDAGHRVDDAHVVLDRRTAPNQPREPNNSTNNRPATTGETVKGRSISEIKHATCRGSRTW